MVKEGFYEGGIFRFVITFPNVYPNKEPTI
mgnify:CR=1 FL=1